MQVTVAATGTNRRTSLRSVQRYDLAQLERVFDQDAIVEVVRQAFIDHEHGKFRSARPTHLILPHGECHVKSGYIVDGDIITIKVATGFYSNEQLGLPNASGFVIALNQRTGMPLALIEDEGWLTAWRTVAASVIAVVAGLGPRPARIGIVGAGLQAQLTAQWLAAVARPASIRLWARSRPRAETLAQQVGATAEFDLAKLCAECDVIVTATPSDSPLILSDWVRPGMHIVALGADQPGKVEIDPAVFARAATIVTDNHDQCLEHGDFGAAVRAGSVAANADVALGAVLANGVRLHRPDGISIVDLTGLAAQDDAIVQLFLKRMAVDLQVGFSNAPDAVGKA